MLCKKNLIRNASGVLATFLNSRPDTTTRNGVNLLHVEGLHSYRRKLVMYVILEEVFILFLITKKKPLLLNLKTFTCHQLPATYIYIYAMFNSSSSLEVRESVGHRGGSYNIGKSSGYRRICGLSLMMPCIILASVSMELRI